MSTPITESSVRDFLMAEAKKLADGVGRGQTVYLACSVLRYPNDNSVRAVWNASVDSFRVQKQADTLEEVIHQISASQLPAALLAHAASLRKQADEIEAKINHT